MTDLGLEALDKIDALARSLGTTAEYLWAALVGDAIRAGIVKAAVGLVVVAVFVITLRRLPELTPEEEASGEPVRGGGAMAICFLAILIGFVVLVLGLTEVAAPHREALSELRRVFR